MKRVVYLIVFGALVFGAYFALRLYDDYKTEIEFQQSIAPYRQMAEESEQYMKYVAREKERTTEMLRADTYGGETPEETLALFVEALEARDAKLASKYYLPWLQKEAEKDMRDWMENYEDGLEKFLEAYKKEILKKDESYVAGISLDIYDSSSDEYPYVIKMQQNKETKLWKITEF